MGTRYSREEVARRGDEIYDRQVLPHFGPEDEGKLVLIDVQTGDYEMDRDEIAASDRLLTRHPDAQVWMRQVGSRYARRFRPWTTAGWRETGTRADHHPPGTAGVSPAHTPRVHGGWL